MACNLPLYHAASLPVWGTIIGNAIVSKHIPADHFISSLDRVCGVACCKFDHPEVFNKKR